jgi:GDP-L-fucose synthase
MDKDSRIYVAGHAGMVGAALCRKLAADGFQQVITRSRAELDLLDQAAVARFFEEAQPEYVFLAAGKTGGIYANNTYRADFIYENIVIQSNVIHQSFLHEVRKLVFFACSCIYPRECPQPMSEEYILTGPLEATNEPFAVAKIAGLKMCEAYNRQYGTDFLSILPTNLYGPGQRYEPLQSVVIPALIAKFSEAKASGARSVSVWGSGEAARDFLYVDDLADASVFVAENYEGTVLVNVGTGVESTIAELAAIVKQEVGYDGGIEFDQMLPAGVQRKLQDLSLIRNLGWKHKMDLRQGLHLTVRDYLER